MSKHHLGIVFAEHMVPVEHLKEVVGPCAAVSYSYRTTVVGRLSEDVLTQAILTLLVKHSGVACRECEVFEETYLSRTGDVERVAVVAVGTELYVIKRVSRTIHRTYQSVYGSVSIIVLRQTGGCICHDVALSITYVERIYRCERAQVEEVT